MSIQRTVTERMLDTTRVSLAGRGIESIYYIRALKHLQEHKILH